MIHNPHRAAVTAFTVATCVLAATQLFWFKTHIWIKAPTPHLVWCIASSGAVALANGMSVLLSDDSYAYYQQLIVIFRCFWVYHYLLLLLSAFQPFGGGGKEETLQAAGEVLNRANLPPLRYKPIFTLFTCACKYVPDAGFLRSAFKRVELYIGGTLLLNCVRLTLYMEGHWHSGTECVAEYAGFLEWAIKLLDLVVVGFGLSGILALDTVLAPLIMPNRRDLTLLRHWMFLYIQPFMAFQEIIIFGLFVPMAVESKCEVRNIQGLTLAVEMALFQAISYKAFVPTFKWEVWGAGLPEPQADLMEKMGE
jgi:hypothetical protein